MGETAQAMVAEWREQRRLVPALPTSAVAKPCAHKLSLAERLEWIRRHFQDGESEEWTIGHILDALIKDARERPNP